MIRLTIYRVGETIEITSKKLVGKDFPSNVVRDFRIELEDHVTITDDEETEYETIKIRPYYRKKANGVLNIYAEEELENGN